MNHDPLHDFLRSLPATYRSSQPETVRREHARLSAERNTTGTLVAVGAVPLPPEPPALCVVADDRPGLLSAISAALSANGFDVLRAEVFSRPREGHPPEAIDLFRVERRDSLDPWADITNRETTAIQHTLGGLLDGSISWAEITSVPAKSPQPGDIGTRVRFLEDEEGKLSVLEVETADRSGLLLALTRALVGQNVTILRSEVHTEASRVLDRFTLSELDGSPITELRRLQVQVAVLGAIDPA